ncbi:ATP dependent DNA ligase domain-containing protein [Thamnocephalis sphaerospora]|uniref:DNA ligase n=1 Tax=Thamnocephalis sphaerospora TaxID=78915 RepID=A0A4P9XQY1_9FUNG|nr:ATP dependent DNA ligase domain-containing protein [Thamnocephalis sphaerospora]|eukprot:RKP08473.1 ATP dependent DNA ligase domain-containing protein [Thamnocephalis sphaerospora]
MDDSSLATEPPAAATAALPFSEVCKLIETLATKRVTEVKQRLLGRFIEAWRIRYGSFYPVLRLLLPHLDVERPTYRFKEATLARSYVDAIGLARESPDAQRLLKWQASWTGRNDVPRDRRRRPGTQQSSAGDLGQVVASVLQPRSTVTGSGHLTVADVNAKLDQLAHASDKKERNAVLTYFIHHCTAKEQKWITRIILKSLRCGISEHTVLGALHPDANALYNVCSDLRRVCDELNDPSVRIGTQASCVPLYMPKITAPTNGQLQSIQLFHPFKPMTCRREKLAAIPKAMDDMPFWLEEKLDGERVQLHKSGKHYRYWSRRALEQSGSYGRSPKSGSLTPHIHELFHESVANVILDGEMLAYDPVLKMMLPFGTVRSASIDQSIDNDRIRPCFMVFDIVFCNGIALVDRPLSQRHELLKKVVCENPGYLQIVPHQEAETTKELSIALDDALMRREEGIIVKNPQSIYQPHVRSPGWIKMKPEYMQSGIKDLDLLVIGGQWGGGKRGGYFGSFVCGIKEHDAASNGQTRYATFCKFGTGFSVDQMREFRQLIFEKGYNFNPESPPAWLRTTSSPRERPDMVIEPQNSFVVTINATEIIPTSYTLRFPRMISVRDDKDADDVMTAADLMALRQTGNGRLQESSPSQTIRTDEASSGKRKKQANRKLPPRKILARFTNSDGEEPQEQASEIFANCNFCVLYGDSENDKATLQRMIKSNGGSYFQDERATRDMIVVSGQKKLVVANLIKRQTHDIILPAWIRDCIQAGEQLVPEDRHYLFLRERDTEHKSREALPERQGASSVEIDTSRNTYASLPHSNENEATGRPVQGTHKHRGESAEPLPESIDGSSTTDYQTSDGELSDTSASANNDDSTTDDEGDGTFASPEMLTQHRRPPACVATHTPSIADDGDASTTDGEEATALERTPLTATPATLAPPSLDEVFSGCTIYLDRYLEPSNPETKKPFSSLDPVDIIVGFCGGVITDQLELPELTHVVVDPADLSRLEAIERAVSVPVVTANWVLACKQARKRLPPDGYSVKDDGPQE